MAKIELTEEQLKEEILKQLGYEAFLTVHRREPPVNYTVGFMTVPVEAAAAQEAVDEIVDELRPLYELID